MIKKITIKQIKGISDRTINLNVYPNKPVILVAPNGTGKSSFAAAFNDLNNKCINLHKDNFYLENENNDPYIELIYKDNENEKTLVADNTKNEIKNDFDIFVINSKLFAKTKQQSFNDRTFSTSTIEVPDVVLISKIPEKLVFDYSYKLFKENYKAKSILPNLSNYLDDLTIEKFLSIDFKKFKLKTNERILNQIKEKIKDLQGNIEKSKKDIESWFETQSFKCDPLMLLMNCFRSEERLFDKLFLSLQVVDIYNHNPDLFSKACKYSAYVNEKKEYENLFETIETTWKNIKPIEDAKKGLVVKFPKAIHISNGERDFLVFLSSLISIRRKIKKENCILIIDEVFDYLDDSNLIVAQYFVSKLIQKIKENKKLYPIILTHLNPYYFKNYRFQKQQVKFMKDIRANVDNDVKKLIEIRNTLSKNDPLKEKLDKYLFHYSYDYNIDLSDDFNENGLSCKLDTPQKFHKEVFSHLQKYIEDKSYCPIAVCCAIRIHIEKNIGDKMSSDEDKEGFIATKMTDNKLEFARDKDIQYPETYNLLGVIYNDGLHLNSNEDKITPIMYKLENKIIKKMIKEVRS